MIKAEEQTVTGTCTFQVAAHQPPTGKGADDEMPAETKRTAARAQSLDPDMRMSVSVQCCREPVREFRSDGESHRRSPSFLSGEARQMFYPFGRVSTRVGFEDQKMRRDGSRHQLSPRTAVKNSCRTFGFAWWAST